MKKGFTVILLTAFLLYRITFPTSVVHAEEVEISAPSGILMEMSTGTVLFEKDADTARPPASVTKIMTPYHLMMKCQLPSMQLLWEDLKYSWNLERCRR